MDERRRRRRGGRAARTPHRSVLAAMLLPALALAGCGGDAGGEPAASAARAHGDGAPDELRGFDRYPVYWLGRSFGGLPLTAIDRHGSFTNVVYGSCEAADDGDCRPPLTIQSVRTCPNTAGLLVRPPSRRLVIRGVPAGFRDGALVLFTGPGEIRVFSQGAVALRAARAARAANGPRGQGPPRRLAPPRPDAERRVPCAEPRG